MIFGMLIGDVTPYSLATPSSLCFEVFLSHGSPSFEERFIITLNRILQISNGKFTQSTYALNHLDVCYQRRMRPLS